MTVLNHGLEDAKNYGLYFHQSEHGADTETQVAGSRVLPDRS